MKKNPGSFLTLITTVIFSLSINAQPPVLTVNSGHTSSNSGVCYSPEGNGFPGYHREVTHPAK